MTARALVRGVSPDFDAAVRVDPAPLSVRRARREHAAYVDLLRELGAEVLVLPPLLGHPDACFVEDTAVVIDGRALITRPGHRSRQGEVHSVAAALAPYASMVSMTAGRLDGGDVLAVGPRLYVGLSGRTDGRGVEALRSTFPNHIVVPVTLRAGLHLKSSATALPDGRILAWPAAVDAGVFVEEVVEVPEGDGPAANVVSVLGTVVVSRGFPRTAERLAKWFPVRELDNRELRKADSALTCLSIWF